MDASYREEMIIITIDKKDWESLHFSDTRYAEPIEFTRNYFEKLGWKVNELRIDGLQAFKLDRDSFVNTYIIFKDHVGRYFFINVLTMGDDKADTPGLGMILKTFKFISK